MGNCILLLLKYNHSACIAIIVFSFMNPNPNDSFDMYIIARRNLMLKPNFFSNGISYIFINLASSLLFNIVIPHPKIKYQN